MKVNERTRFLAHASSKSAKRQKSHNLVKGEQGDAVCCEFFPNLPKDSSPPFELTFSLFGAMDFLLWRCSFCGAIPA
jgi:hypothetical protein